MRFRASITVVIEYDADDKHDAQAVADKLANTVSVPTPLGRDAELTNVKKAVVNL